MKGKKRVVFYVLDGAHFDVLSELILKGELPNMKRIMDEGSYRKATTCSPQPPALHIYLF